MATISSVFKMQDNATKTFNNVSNAIEDVITKADRLSAETSNMGAGMSNINPVLAKALEKYQDLIANQDEINAKIDIMKTKEKNIANELATENRLYQKNEKAIGRLQLQQQTVAAQKDKLIRQSDKLTKQIEQQAKTVSDVYDHMNDIPPIQEQVSNGFGKWGNKMILINQALQLTKSIVRGISSGLNYTDNLTLGKVRLDFINDGLQTTEELQNKIFTAAQRSRGSYDDMSRSIAKLGLLAKDSFKSNDEMIAFSEMMNKSFKISGASNQEINSATYQLTQAMAAGRLQGDEFRSIMENAPMLADAIAKYMGKPKAELRKLSSEGKITSDIIKNALFSAADDINEKYEQMPKTFGDAMTNIKNTASRYLQPVADKITEFLNSEQFNKALNSILSGIKWFAGLAMAAFSAIGKVSNWVREHLWLVVPALGAVAAVMLLSVTPATIAAKKAAEKAALAWLKLNSQMMGIVGIAAIVIGVLWAVKAPMEAIIGVIAAMVIVLALWKIHQWQVNAAMYACPIVWIIALIVALITAIYVLITWILKLVKSNNTAMGIICGAVNTAVAFIYNLFLSLLDLILGMVNYIVNPWISLANFFGNLFTDPIGAIIKQFGSLADRVLGICETIAKVIDKVFGSNLADSVKGWRSGLKNLTENAVKKYGNGSYQEIASELNLSSDSLGLKRMEYGDAYNKGLKFGNDLAEKIDKFDPTSLLNIPSMEDYTKDYDFSSMVDPNGNIPVDIKKNSDKEVNISDEDLRMLKDIATRDYMLNYKHITPNVNIEFGDVRETADVNKIKDALTKMMDQELSELYVVEEG